MSSRTSIAVGHSRHRTRPCSHHLPVPFSYDVVPSGYLHRKGILDRILAGLLLIPGLPLIGILVLLVRLTSRGPGIFRQVRVGKNGRSYLMFKVRTMRHDAEAATGPVWTQANDVRITRVGKWLRRLHLDELPQLFNVLRGEMSLVGPRPERPEFVYVLAEAVPGYLNRLAVPPGITGLAQLNLPPDSDVTSVRRKLTLDCQYIEQANLLLDLRLILCTLGRMFKLPEGLLLWAFALRRAASLPESTLIAPGGADGPDRVVPTPAEIASQAGKTAAGGDGERGKPHHRRANKAKVKPK